MTGGGAGASSVGGGGSNTGGAAGAAGAAAMAGAAGSGQPLLPFGGSSKGSGGPAPMDGTPVQSDGIDYRLIVPPSPQKSAPFLIVYSGVEGGAQKTNNLLQVGQFTGIDGFICAVLDGKIYNGNGDAGAKVLDAVHAQYDVDNDRTYLLGEPAGTSAALKLGFNLRQEYFAAYWANDVNATGTPSKTAAELRFAPWGQAGPGGQLATANSIVAAMQTAGYRLPNPAPYAGKGADQHGSPDQLIAAVSWFPGKTRQ
jgi:hypothetical protein